MTKPIATVAVSELQRSTKKVLEDLDSYALIQSHGRNRGLLVSAELAEKLLASGALEGLLTIPTRDDAKEGGAGHADRPTANVATSSLPTMTEPSPLDVGTLARLITPVLDALDQ
jgi:hypothetical protein